MTDFLISRDIFDSCVKFLVTNCTYSNGCGNQRQIQIDKDPRSMPCQVLYPVTYALEFIAPLAERAFRKLSADTQKIVTEHPFEVTVGALSFLYLYKPGLDLFSYLLCCANRKPAPNRSICSRICGSVKNVFSTTVKYGIFGTAAVSISVSWLKEYNRANISSWQKNHMEEAALGLLFTGVAIRGVAELLKYKADRQAAEKVNKKRIFDVNNMWIKILESGNVDALYKTGHDLEPANLNLAITMYEAAAEKGHSPSLMRLSSIYQNIDPSKAAHYNSLLARNLRGQTPSQKTEGPQAQQDGAPQDEATPPLIPEGEPQK